MSDWQGSRLSQYNFHLPKNIERYLGALSRLYAQDGKRACQEILVNAQHRVHEEWGNHTDFGQDYVGHALYLVIPEELYLSVINVKEKFQNEIKADINRLHNVRNEFIEEVFIEIDIAENSDWRKESGLLLDGRKSVPPDAESRIWGDGFRLFVSHKSEVKVETAELKSKLSLFGVSCFVAHEDIHPTKAWQDEIENALGSMDGFVALMMPNFHDSDWTDQEVGFAVARGVPIIAVRLGTNPYGFIGKFQALPTDWGSAPLEIIKILIKLTQMFGAYTRALRRCPNWDSGNLLAKVLPSIERLSESQLDALVSAYNETNELQGAFGFNGTKPNYHGRGLVPHLNRLGVRKFKYSPDWKIEVDR